MIKKLCPFCKEEKLIENFSLSKQTKDGFRSWCKNCCNINNRYYGSKNRKGQRRHNREYYIANREKILARTKAWAEQNKEKMKVYNRVSKNKNRVKNKEKERLNKIKYKYNLTEENYIDLLDAQNFRCALCNIELKTLSTKNIHVDHLHGTNIVRGILCSMCNKGLGHFKDNIESLQRGIEYIKKYAQER